MDSGLDLSPDRFRELGHQLIEAIASHYESLPSLPVMPDITAQALEQLFREPVPRESTDAAALLDQVIAKIFPNTRQNGHPGFFGYVASPGTPVTALGDLAISALNTNVTGWRSSPAGTAVEQTALEWIRTLIGMPTGTGGLFVSGGSMANFSGLAAARSAVFPDVAARGVSGLREPRIYATQEVHLSVPKAAAMLGLGTSAMHWVEHDSRMRIDVDSLRRAIREDQARNYTPMCIVASAGTASTGAVDDLQSIAEVARERKVWLHVDGSYGDFALLAPSARDKFAGIEQADSISLDPHKWLYLPLDCGCVLYRDPASAVRAFSYHAEYTRPVGLHDAEAFAFWDYGPELSRRFRALNVWLQIKAAGLDAIAAAIESNLQCARYFESLIKQAGDFEMLCPVELSIFCFRFKPPDVTAEDDLDSINAAVLQRLQRTTRSYLSNAKVHGRFALRGCVLNWRTTRRDMEQLLEDVRSVARLIVAA